jgi:hypothetical protein
MGRFKRSDEMGDGRKPFGRAEDFGESPGQSLRT